MPTRISLAVALAGCAAALALGHAGAAETEPVKITPEPLGLKTGAPREFAMKYGWKNNPAAVRLTGN
jgi:hypothetical protein